MRILLISANRELLPDPVFPLGLACLSGALAGSRHEHALVDLCFEEDWAAAVENAVRAFEPQAVGLSIRNVDNVAFPNFHSYLPFCRQVVQHVRSLAPGVPVILGGSGFSVMPAPILSYLEADYGIAGEGEWSLVQLLDCLEEESAPDVVPGLYRAMETSLTPPRIAPTCGDFSRLPLPVRSGLARRQYLDRGGMGNLQTKRGCSFCCIYCTYPLIEGRNVRLRSPSDVVDELAREVEAGIDTFFIVDDIFNFPPHHARSVCQGIVERGLKIRWSCYLHPRFVTESLLALMKTAGCTSVEFGVDSGSDPQLVRLGKAFTSTDIRRTSELCHAAGMPFCHSLIFGGPGEDEQTIRETFDLMGEVDPTAVIAMVGIRVFPGTELARSADQDDLVLTGSTLLEPAFYIARSCRSFLLDRVRSHASQHSNWILPGSNVNIDDRIQSRLRRYGLRGPLWEYMRVRRRDG